MAFPKLPTEPYEVSPRFYAAMHAKASSLEANAQQDELFAASLEHPGHRERQNRLVLAQREQAERFRNFLADTRLRVK
jgi:hypothetical protein